MLFLGVEVVLEQRARFGRARDVDAARRRARAEQIQRGVELDVLDLDGPGLWLEARLAVPQGGQEEVFFASVMNGEDPAQQLDPRLELPTVARRPLRHGEQIGGVAPEGGVNQDETEDRGRDGVERGAGLSPIARFRCRWCGD
jgi:hypothetical protein